MSCMFYDQQDFEIRGENMKVREFLKGERGAATIIEAAFVFPIMFFIVFFMIMVGESYYQYARVEYEVIHGAVSAAARCENPMLSYVQANDSVPTDPGETDVIPYRYILTGEAASIANTSADDLEDTINAMEPLLFKGMAPTNVDVTVTPKMNVLVSSITVKCDFEVPLPIRMIFSGKKLAFRYSIEVKEPIGDPAEFVRNVSTVKDVVERNKAISDFCSELKEKATKIGVYLG